MTPTNPLPPGPVEPVTVEFPGGKKRLLRYTIRSFTRLKTQLGRSLIGRDGALATMGEDVLPVLIYEGLRGADGTPSDITLEEIETLPAAYFPYLLRCFSVAWSGSMPAEPEKNALQAPESPKPPPLN